MHIIAAGFRAALRATDRRSQSGQLLVDPRRARVPQAIARQGHIPDAVPSEIAAMNAKLDALGVILDCDPRKVTKTSVIQTDPTSGAS